jgi:hypothetical protein
MVDISDLAQRLALPTRQVRYVFDHDVLPGSEEAGQGRGVPRVLTEFEAFGVACAAVLLHAGARREVVRRCLSVTTQLPNRQAPDTDRLLWKAFHAVSARLDIGDGAYVRVRGNDLPKKVWDSGWKLLVPGAAAAASCYEPLVQTTIDLTRIKGQLGI